MKKIIGMALCLSMTAMLFTGCSSSGSGGADKKDSSGNNKVGVALPTKELQRWNQDGANIKKELEAAGYEVDLQYAGNDNAQMVSIVENMISGGCKVLVITPIDGDALGSVLKTAKEDGVEVINYDRMITNTDAVSYLATFDNTGVGEKQGEYIVDKLDLENTDQTFNLEIVSGDPGDNNATYFYNGAMSILQPYIDSGKLVVKSGQVSKDDTATANWDTEKAQSRMDAIIASYYADGTNLDAVLCSNDSTALGTANALESSYTGSWPIITGQDCDIANVKNIVKGKQTMSVFKDTRKLAKVTVKMVNSIMKGEEVEVNDTITYDNGAKVIPTYVVDPIAVDQDNYKEILIEGGYYTEAELQ